MDNDDLRRGRPTSHKVFGEGMAVLAGDALLTVAFGLLAQTQPWVGKEGPRYTLVPMVAELARAAGSRGMIAGQVADLEAEGKPVAAMTLEELRFIHVSKTAALLIAALRLGGMSANAAPELLAALTAFGSHLGLAFQVIDDILDVTQTSEKLGKSAGKDLAAQKATYPALLGLEASRQEAARLTEAALEALEPFGAAGATLRAIGRYLLEREY
jgi:geranylgeranyl diphosphate synthase type II